MPTTDPGRDPERIKQLEAEGWEYFPASLYGEEGIEGWRWNGPNGEEYHSIGDWCEPPTIPEALQLEEEARQHPFPKHCEVPCYGATEQGPPGA